MLTAETGREGERSGQRGTQNTPTCSDGLLLRCIIFYTYYFWNFFMFYGTKYRDWRIEYDVRVSITSVTSEYIVLQKKLTRQTMYV